MDTLEPVGAPVELRIDSATGVDVSHAIVGPGGRAYAFMIDWHIRVVLAIAWYGAAALLMRLGEGFGRSLTIPTDPSGRWLLTVALPAGAIYFLYHPVLELLMRGRTPGKRIAGVRILARDGRTPGPGALLIRNVFRLIDSFPALYGIGLITTLLTREHVRIGDLAAGTLLVYERSPQAALPARTAWDPELSELGIELIARWRELDPAARRDLADRLIARSGQPAVGGNDAAADRERQALLRRLGGNEPA
jgi:uncharacterized RDD family membrane protein YckC